jgi:hypothetical protein
MTGFALIGALGTAWAICAGATGTITGTFTTTMGQTKADKQHDEKEQWCDVAFHTPIVDPQSP